MTDKSKGAGGDSKRRSSRSRKTLETKLSIELDLDGSGTFEGDIGVPFFEHMLHLLVRHALFDLRLKGAGDTTVDAHHTVEDTGILLGEAFAEALGGKAGIRRYGTAYVPMEESLARAVVDLCNRPYFEIGAEIPKSKVGTFDTELGEEFFRAFFVNARITAHVDVLRGGNLHHVLEACFKAVGLALREACSRDEKSQGVLSTKGVL